MEPNAPNFGVSPGEDKGVQSPISIPKPQGEKPDRAPILHKGVVKEISHNEVVRTEKWLGSRTFGSCYLAYYNHRVKVVKLVTDYESKIAVNKSPKQQRNLVTKFISGKHSRQEFLPFVGPAIDKAKCEPIHLGNNCWQEWNKQVMTIALARTNTDPAIATVD